MWSVFFFEFWYIWTQQIVTTVEISPVIGQNKIIKYQIETHHNKKILKKKQKTKML